MSYDANSMIADDSVLARLSQIAAKKSRLEPSESCLKETDTRVESTGRKRLKRKRRSQTIQADDDPATEKDQVDTRPGNLTNKKPKSTGGHDQVKELTAWYQVSHAHKLNDLNEAFKWNHQCLLNDLGEPGLGHREPSQGYDIVHAADIDHYLDCTARQRTLWNKMRMVKDVMFKVGLKQEIRGWSSADVFGYRDKLDLAYLRVLRKLQVEGAANLKRAQAKMGTRDDSQAVQKKRDTVNEEIRRLENGLSDE